ncbi:MAG TPA: EB domain-containing protein [Polyangiaceae bacterium]|nr:EB domain-containing protein [Polyangiaceae bacterium]
MSRGARSVFFLSSALAVFASCSSSDTKVGAQLAEGCSINSDCNAPLVCAFRRCHNECVSTRDCPAGQRCVASDRPFRVCQLGEERACTSNVECPLGMVCGVDGQCRDQCVSDRDCIAGQICTAGTCADRSEIVDGGLPPATFDGGRPPPPTCVYSSDCPEPLVCRGGACIVECRERRDCDYLADCVNGRCVLGGFGGVSGAGGAGGTGVAGAAGTAGSGGNGPGSGGAPGSGGTLGGSGGTGAGGSGTVTLFDCQSRTTTSATVADADITTDQTWSGVIHVTQNVRVYGGATITISPGTSIIVDPQKTIEFGWAAAPATLLASGTAQAPIVFCGSVGDPGTWTSLLIDKTATTSSTLANVLISDAGSGSAALVLHSGVTVTNLQVRNSGSDGVLADDFHAGSTALSVDGTAGAAVVFATPAAVNRFPVGGALTNVGSGVVLLTFTTIDVDTTFRDLGLPYLQQYSVDVAGAVTATFEAGVEYRVAAGRDLEIGWNQTGSTLAVDGTAAKPVTFRGETAVAGNWGGIAVDSKATSLSHIRHAKILHAGNGEKALAVNVPITIEDLSLDLNATGMSVADVGLNADSTVLSITRTSGVPLTADLNALHTLPTGGTLTGNTTDRIDVGTSGYYDVQGVIPDLGIPYYLTGDVDIRNGAVFEPAPGTHFLVGGSFAIDVGYGSTPGAVIAKGTAQKPILFEGFDTSAGYWEGLIFRSSSLSTSALDYVTVKSGGKVNTGGVWLQKEIPVTHTTVTGSAGYGIYYSSAFSTNYTTTNTLTGNTQGPTGTF